MKIKNVFRSYSAAFLYGRGLMRFHQKRYEEAARIFEKVCRLDPGQERKQLVYSYLGRSLLKIGKRDEALDILSKAYELFTERTQRFNDEFEHREFLSFVRDYLEALKEAGQNDRAREIESRVGR